MDSELKKSILKTGTTIVGIVCKDGIVMAADRQVTAGKLVYLKNFKKIIQINDYLMISWTGVVSDAQQITKIIAAELKLKELRSRKRPTVKEAANLVSSLIYSFVRRPSMVPYIVGVLVGGFNEDGSTELYTLDPSGSVSKVEDYDANFGSGMPFVLGLLERQYKPGISIKEGIDLAVEAIKSSTQRDVGSGYGIDVFTITKEGIKHVVSQEILPDYKSS
ncbi:MAG: proteasome subunit beta [Candidatus Pacearchaeota archaeon]|nr:MAG: proteasome subunit beta [Candidatus Pacearchaeota archaeon]